MKQIDKLTWKYFVQQKVKEVFSVVVFIAVLSIISYGIGKLLLDSGDTLAYISYGMGIVVLGIISLGVVGALLYMWIDSNWIKAKERAEAEVNRRW